MRPRRVDLDGGVVSGAWERAISVDGTGRSMVNEVVVVAGASVGARKTARSFLCGEGAMFRARPSSGCR